MAETPEWWMQMKKGVCEEIDSGIGMPVLSSRELEVLKLLAEGLIKKQIRRSSFRQQGAAIVANRPAMLHLAHGAIAQVAVTGAAPSLAPATTGAMDLGSFEFFSNKTGADPPFAHA